MSDMTNKAQLQATEKHIDQIDDDGQPHYEHCAKVVKILSAVRPNDENLIIAGWLHDTIEDVGMTREDIEDFYNADVADLVWQVTKVDGKFPNLHSRRAIILKFADRLHNISRMDAWDDKRQQAYLDKSRFW